MDKLTVLLNDYIIKPHVFEERARLSHYPSAASAINRQTGGVLGKCHRSSWYDWKGYKATNPIDARGMWTFAHGHKIEALFTEYFKQLGLWAGNNIKWYNKEHNLSGEIDIMLFDNPEITPTGIVKKLLGVEIKTAYGYGFQKSTSQAPKPENLMQVMIYLDHWMKALPNLINEWRLIYMARDTHETAEYAIKLDKDDVGTFATVDGTPYKLFYLEDVYTRYKKLGEHAIANTCPPQDYTYGFDMTQSEERFAKGTITKTAMAHIKSGKKLDSDWQCNYCNHLNRCWPEKRAKVRGTN